MTPIFDAVAQLIADSPATCKRVFHGRGHCYPGLEWVTVDWYKPLLWVCLFKKPDANWLTDFKNQLISVMSQSADVIQSIQLQHRYEKGAPAELVAGKSIGDLVAQEDDLQFYVKFGQQQNTGLFLDMANGRQWLRRHSSGKRVLNLFSYTCGFSVAAIAGGADKVVNVDKSKSALSWGRDNHRLNKQDLTKVQFFSHDVMNSWSKFKRLGPFDLIVVDPPSFQKGSFIATKDYPKLGRKLRGLLNEQGQVLACLNAPELTLGFVRDALESGGLTWQERLSNPDTFPEKYPDKGLKVLRFSAS